MVKNLEKLSGLPGVSGGEHAVREYILTKIKRYASEITVNGQGSVIALKKGEKPGSRRLMVSAHMDEVGLIVTYICDDGMLKFTSVGGIDPSVLCGRAVSVGENRVTGVIGIVPIHLSRGEAKSKIPDINEMYIDIGAPSRAEAEKLVSPGDLCCFETQFEPFGDGMLKGKALDDRAGCAVLLELIKQQFPCDIYFVFTTQEEVGLRGAGCAAYTVDPDTAIVVEATTAADIAGVEEQDQVCRLGGGAVVGFMDKRTIYDRELYELALDLARMKGIKAQIKQAVAGGNDAGAIQRTRGGVRTLAVSLPCRYLHSPASVIAESDLKSVCELVGELLYTLSI